MHSKLLISLAIAGAVLGSSSALGSSHREAPFITKYPQVDATDFYLFKSYEPGREEFVTNAQHPDDRPVDSFPGHVPPDRQGYDTIGESRGMRIPAMSHLCHRSAMMRT